MSRNEEKQSVHTFLDQSFTRVRELPAEHVDSACDAVLHRLRTQPDDVTEAADVELVRPSARWFRPAFAFAALAITAILMVLLQMPRPEAIAWVESAEGGLYGVDGGDALNPGETIEEDQAVGTDGGRGSVLKLADGSTIEMRSKSQLSIESQNDGIRIHLNKGSVIVNAAKQRTGHLYVQTKHMTVSVVATVFLVSAEEEGSRVAVIEGEVHVQLGQTEKRLLQGEQVATNPKMPLLPVKEEIAWSRHAKAHVALLGQATSRIGAAPRPGRTEETQPETPQNSLAVKETFTLSTVKLRGAPALEGRGGGTSDRECNSLPFQVDPGRFAVSNINLYTLIIRAYSDRDCSEVREFEENLLSGGPGWIMNDRFDIEALIPEGSSAGKEFTEGKRAKLKAMLQALLEDRFKLLLRRPQKEMQVYLLRLAGSGSKLTPAREGDRRGGGFGPAGPAPQSLNAFSLTKASSVDIARTLGVGLRRPVLDLTGLTGEFSFRVEYMPLADQPGAWRFQDSTVTGPTLFEAIEEKLGLKLEPARAPVEVLIIERVERPSEN